MSDNFDLDDLRQRSERRSSAQGDVEAFDDNRGGGGFLSQFTAGQRLILAVLLLVDILVVGFVLLSITGVL